MCAAMDLTKLIVTVIVAVVGWFICHRLSAWRDRVSKQRDQKIEYLIEAFRLLSEVTNHPRLHEVNLQLRAAFAIIQLFGTEDQNTLIATFVDEMRKHSKSNIDRLLQNLRNALRQELDLVEIKDDIRWLWVEPSSDVPHDEVQLTDER